MSDKYFMVRVPNYAGTPEDLEAELRWHFQRSVSVVNISDHAPNVAVVVEAFDEWERTQSGFALRDADETRAELAEDLWQRFADMVPLPEREL